MTFYTHFHDGTPIVYEGECPTCTAILAVDPTAIITDAAPAAVIDCG